jgi:hypothetical protein
VICLLFEGNFGYILDTINYIVVNPNNQFFFIRAHLVDEIQIKTCVHFVSNFILKEYMKKSSHLTKEKGKSKTLASG